MRSLLNYYEKKKKEAKSVTLFFGAQSPELMPFKKDLKRWKKQFDIKLSVDRKSKGWKGNVGFVTELIKKHEFPKDSVAVFCGPPIMFHVTAKILAEKGFSDDDMIVSLERNMRCGVGECLHCNIGDKLVCKDGPVFRWSEVKGLE